MKNASNRSKVASIALFLMLTISALIVALPAASAQKETTTAYLSIRPNPIGVGQELLINAWTTPTPHLNLSAPLFPGLNFFSGDHRFNNMIYATDPDGQTTELGPFESYGEGTFWTVFVPDKVGEWTIRYTWPGDEDFTGSETETKLVVQQDPIPSWPETAFPTTESWDWPVTPDNREWANYIGGYWEPTTGEGRGYDSSGSRANPYAKAPNSAHILWKLPSPSGIAGLVGQPYGQLQTYTTSVAAINVVMYGRGYYQTGGNIHCVDIRTGEELWCVPGSYTLGTIDMAPQFLGAPSAQPVLLYLGERIVKYDALTGAKILDVEGPPKGMDLNFAGISGYKAFQYPYAYYAQALGTITPTTYVGAVQGYQILKVDTTGTATDVQDRIMWNVTYPTSALDVGVVIQNNALVIAFFDDYGETASFDLTTGAVLWHKSIDDFEQKPEAVTSGYGNYYHSVRNRHFVARDARTGNIVWTSEQTDYPWGGFFSYGEACAYNMVYGLSYAGVYAFNVENGDIEWHYSAGDSGMETPYSTYPFGSADPIVADGKVFAPNTEHTPTFYYRGYRLHAINAYDGTGIWSIAGYYSCNAVAEGTLFATNTYDGCSYAFAKGETATTVSVQNDLVAKGETILIKGTVMDMSPAQEGTAAISDASMSDWMEYLHMDQPLPMDATGVAVSVNAIDPTGAYITIGTATSNTDGEYALLFTPTLEGTYNIVAYFEGSESYYASHDTTYLGVGPAAATGGPIEPEAEAPLISTEVAIIAAVAVVAVIGIAAYWILKKRK